MYGGTITDLKHFYLSSDGVVDDIECSPKMLSSQTEREPLSENQNVVFAPRGPKVDVYVSRTLSKGSLFEQNAVVAVARPTI